MARPTREYLQWLEENNFSPEDEELILKTATRMAILWFLISCIPTLGIFALPLLINAWTQRKIVKQKSFEPRPGLLYSLFAIAMYISYILIIPWIFAMIARKAYWGSGLRKLIKQGKVGNGYAAECDPISPSSADHQSHGNVSHFPWAAILIVIAVIMAVVVAITYFGDAKEPAQAESTLPIDQGSHSNATDHRISVPDFSAALSAEEILAIAQQHDLAVQVEYTDQAFNIYDSIPNGMMIESISQDPAVGTELPAGTSVHIRVTLKPMYSLAGHWYNAECMYDTLYLAQYHFREDGTFSYYYMGYMAVDYETDLYTYGTYWCGAMGADSYEGTYYTDGNSLVLSYEYWDWGTETTQKTNAYYSFAIEGETLTLNNEAAGISSQYLPGTQPDPGATLAFRIDGSWYALGTPQNGESLPVHTFYFWSNGEFKSKYCHYLHSSDGWYFPGAGSTLVGTYTFDGTTLVLQYTKELTDIYDNDGNIVGTDSIPHNETQIITLTIDGQQVTSVTCDDLILSCMVRIAPSPYVNVDITEEPLHHANQLFP